MTNTPTSQTTGTWTAQRKAKAQRRAQQVAGTRAVAKERREIEVVKRGMAPARRISEGTIRWVMESGYSRQEAALGSSRTSRVRDNWARPRTMGGGEV